MEGTLKVKPFELFIFFNRVILSNSHGENG